MVGGTVVVVVSGVVVVVVSGTVVVVVSGTVVLVVMTDGSRGEADPLAAKNVVAITATGRATESGPEPAERSWRLCGEEC